MSWQDQLKGDSLAWLLEPDSPEVRYLALRDLLDRPNDDPELQAARQLAHSEGPIAEVLAQMDAEGYWAKPGPGYNPKYHSTVWSLILLAQLGASATEDERVSRACAYLLDQALAPGGQFSYNGAPSGTIDCLQGNLCWALLEMGYHDPQGVLRDPQGVLRDPRLEAAYEWMARSVTGEGVAPVEDRRAPVRYYGYKCGPTFACSANDRLPCAWGGTKILLALGKWPAAARTRLMDDAIRQGVDFLLAGDPARAEYPSPSTGKPSGSWWKFGFPVFYVTDILQVAEALVQLGYGHDPRLANALGLILQKQDAQGRWPLEYDYHGKTWVDFGAKRQPNKWVTLRALRVLKAIGDARSV